jgi:hypothetical protein
MSDSPLPADEFNISSKVKKIAPVKEGDVNITEGQAQLITEFVGSPVYSVIKKKVVPQRKDQIARRSLSESRDYEQILFHRGEVFELTQFFRILEAVKDRFVKEHTPESEKRFKK